MVLLKDYEEDAKAIRIFSHSENWKRFVTDLTSFLQIFIIYTNGEIEYFGGQLYQ